jgi:hypothetical protein
MQLSSAQHDALRRLVGSAENVVGYSGNTIAVDRGGRVEDAALVYVVDGKRAAPIADVGGLPVEVLEVGMPVVQARPASPQVEVEAPTRPIVGGISVGALNSSTGTLGYFVRDDDDHLAVLSCGHVLHPQGREMLQPGPADGGGPADRIGVVTETVDVDEEMDAAYGLIDDEIEAEVRIEGIGVVPGTAGAVVGEAARKRGATTGLTQGTVGDVDAYIRVGPPGAPLVNQLRIDGNDLSGDGDSGSLWVNGNRAALGLHWAGNDAHTRAWAYKIDEVLARLGVTLA